MNFIDKQIEQYALTHSHAESEVLKNLARETHLKVLAPRMLSGHLQGNILEMYSCMIKPNSVLEVGTYTGYSAICLAQGVSPGGMLHTIDINEELEEMARDAFKNAGVSERITQHFGNAVDIIPTIDSRFDLVFIDADKINYQTYYDLVIDKVNIGGFVIADNVLWSGKVLTNPKEMDNDTKAIHEFNEMITEDKRVKNTLLPVRDGLMIAQKINP